MSSTLFTTPITIGSATQLPKLVYGTAWKKERSADLVYAAIKAGFRGIDTAAQPRHYQEDLVGDGIRKAIQDGIVKRKDLYVQTKYTTPAGQDPSRMPYSPALPIADQVKTSITSSLHNLSTPDVPTTYIDSVLLHSPLPTLDATLIAWKTLEQFVADGQIRHLGISNVPFDMLLALYDAATVKPAVVQNRFYPDTHWEGELRAFCREKGIIFQSFWTLTANPRLLKSTLIRTVAEKAGVEKEIAFYGFVLGLEGIVILDGTTNEVHMKSDLEGLEKVGSWAENEGNEEWKKLLSQFKDAIGDTAFS